MNDNYLPTDDEIRKGIYRWSDGLDRFVRVPSLLERLNTVVTFLWKRLVFGVDVLFILTVKVPLFMVSWSVGKVIGFMAVGFWVGVKDSWRDVR